MLAPMKRFIDSLRGLNAVSRMQWMVSMLAIVGCLWSAGTVHNHDGGLYALDSVCISCDLEDLVAHGAAVTTTVAITSSLSHIEPAVSAAAYHVTAARAAASIRAPPFFS